MSRLAIAGLALFGLISSVTVADARGGRTSAADCEPGSPDPDCPDTAPSKTGQTSTPTPPPPKK